MFLDLLILGGICVVLVLQWWQQKELNDIKVVIGVILTDIHKAGISSFEVVEDD